MRTPGKPCICEVLESFMFLHSIKTNKRLLVKVAKEQVYVEVFW